MLLCFSAPGFAIKLGISKAQLPPIAYIYLSDAGFKLRPKGILYELSKLIAEETKQATEHVFLERGEVDEALNSGQVHTFCYTHPAWRGPSLSTILFSKPFMEDINIIVSRSNYPHTINSAKDLYGKTLGLVEDYVYPDLEQVLNQELIDTRYFSREMTSLQSLFAPNPTDLVVTKQTSLNYYKESMPLMVSLRAHPLKFDSKMVSCAIPERFKAFLPAIDRAVERFISTYPE